MQLRAELINGNSNLGNFRGKQKRSNRTIDHRRSKSNARDFDLRSLPKAKATPASRPLVLRHLSGAPERFHPGFKGGPALSRRCAIRQGLQINDAMGTSRREGYISQWQYPWRRGCYIAWKFPSPGKQSGKPGVNRLPDFPILGDGSRKQDAVFGGPVFAGVLPHIVPTPKHVPRDRAGFRLVQQTIEIAFVKPVAVTALFPSPLGKGQRLGLPKFLRQLFKLVFGELVGMPIVEIEPGLVKEIFRMLDRAVDMGDGNRPEDGIQLVAELLSSAQVTGREFTLIPEQPRHDRGRIPIAADRAL